MNTENEIINPQEVKKQSEKIILNAGGEILDCLPIIGEVKPRSLNEIINRALIFNAVYQLNMKAPKWCLSNWIEEHELETYLRPKEWGFLYTSNELTNEERWELYWSLDSLWTILWATGLIETLSFDQQVGDELAGLSPNLQINENSSKYASMMKLRSTKSLYSMLDLYYRVHWWFRNNALTKKEQPKNIDINQIIARRQALEWILNSDVDWDAVNLST
ncbi:DUF4272 domain-containing protein [Legionella sp.]|uniref:DUF4272 domain-containing protein n=1 Tax=Legionella sp. TaxID=459 RepID=UPI003CB891D8